MSPIPGVADALGAASDTTLHAPSGAKAKRARIVSVDALRGFVMLLMLVDHTREFFYYHLQVSDPMALPATPPTLFFTRLAAHLCAPVFVLLTGLAASLYADSRSGQGGSGQGGSGQGGSGRAAASSFLLKRGLFLVALEWTVVNFAWSFDPTPATVFLQVIWVIGLSMIALAALVHLPRIAVLVVGLTIVLGHNVLDPITFTPDQPGYVAWSVLHDRGFVDLPFGAKARTSYPLLPWIGVIALGWSIGPWFARAVDRDVRRRRLLLTGAAAIALFAVLRAINGYGEPLPWQVGTTPLATIMSILNLTKYPPSADFILLTLGIGMLLLARFERASARWNGMLVVFGSAPLFFYILHLYLLHGINRLIGAAVGGASDGLVGVPNVASIWLVAATVAVPCWFACRWFGRFKRVHTGWWWRYL
ncbi:DUF1624 domain-containing protein [Sphingomonas sp. HMP9]|uniref:DUF1624 domain-containing protein n=1 Tax=Sphingomonas sp. HMP9 TaxID=1517554 RepID=UPI001E3173EC|nr:heparan-alpha-glucosaminide N-acetyltransferase domain-containing protein [Sphingomonas sp. HMP9]